MRENRTRFARLGLLGSTLAVLAAACGTAGPAAPATVAPPAAASGAGDDVLAADAGMYASFRFLNAGGPSEIPGFGPSAWEMLGANLLNADSAAVLGVDPQRPVVLSSAIVDPTRLRELLASPRAPSADTPLMIRLQVVVPVLDPARAQSALDVLMRESVCARPRRDAARWAALLARLPDRDDRRTAEASDAAYVCKTDLASIVVRMNETRRELRWTAASGEGSGLTAAAAPVPGAPELTVRLRREGFFAAARGAIFTMPLEGARAAAALGLMKTRAGVGGVEASLRDQMWRRGAHEVSAALRLIESPPALFWGFLGTDEAMSWILTEKGKALFA
ncbi:MAG TPA: hypothetical protein VNR90_10955, partial [Vicinamibacterales bacterium]|nr:hypothetical protein [Vicinamibacterales bacterium]